MRVLGIDHGEKRMGIAISDELGTLATPLEFIAAEPFGPFLQRLKELIASYEVELIVVGMPRNMDGTYGPAALKVTAFIAVLKNALTIPIKSWDERLTTVQATRMLREAGHKSKNQKKKVDQSAAALLLQSYLDSIGSETF